MKICDVVINSVWFDPRVRKQIVEYLANDAQVSVVGYKCSRYNAEKVAQMPCKVQLAEHDASYYGRQRNVFRTLKREIMRYKMVRDAIIAEKPDIIHANDLDALLPAYAARRKLGCRLIYDSHEICTENHSLINHPLRAKFFRMLERHIVRRVDKMVCVSHAAADYFAKQYGIEKPMVVTNCSLKKEIVSAPEEKNPGFEVLNHGRFYGGRGYDLMAQACPLLKDYPQIKLAIRGDGKMEEELRQTVAKCDNPEQFIFYPPVLVHELIPYAAKSHVGVAITESICLNFELSVSNKLFEYASAGLPVIMSDIPEHRYLNEKYNFGVIIPENTPQAIADAVIALYQDTERYQQLSENAKKLSVEVNWENDFGKLIAFERSLLEKEGSTRS